MYIWPHTKTIKVKVLEVIFCSCPCIFSFILKNFSLGFLWPGSFIAIKLKQTAILILRLKKNLFPKTLISAYDCALNTN